MWFDTWADLGRVLLIGVAAYAVLVAVIRLSGKRTLSQLNAFDFIVTVALGSTLATILLSSDVSWTEGASALILLAGLQFVLAWISSRVPAFRTLITARPAVVLWHGEMRPEALRRNRLAESEVYQAVRSSGSGDLSTIAAVVLETNGKLSVISRQSQGDGSALQDL
ncbi:DUF421 domain-containing protein [Nesterenkonia lutea]|uniref:Uncharacterized membrane protein YcaP (DUF421 family) n=1 Tax=Nesterenkonia lutea TaxID=272919 RepID=A0ABR9JHM9_9MICC|nr:YetF domain-containing protein [Nesterenkonia lutea]MBE1525283.1 uncharacterized membrane protein YcaP (DUF421 family) [Nesterenkonia lutea]